MITKNIFAFSILLIGYCAHTFSAAQDTKAQEKSNAIQKQALARSEKFTFSQQDIARAAKISADEIPEISNYDVEIVPEGGTFKIDANGQAHFYAAGTRLATASNNTFVSIPEEHQKIKRHIEHVPAVVNLQVSYDSDTEPELDMLVYPNCSEGPVSVLAQPVAQTPASAHQAPTSVVQIPALIAQQPAPAQQAQFDDAIILHEGIQKAQNSFGDRKANNSAQKVARVAESYRVPPLPLHLLQVAAHQAANHVRNAIVLHESMQKAQNSFGDQKANKANPVRAAIARHALPTESTCCVCYGFSCATQCSGCSCKICSTKSCCISARIAPEPPHMQR